VTAVEEIAGWASDLSAADVPERVRSLCRAQRRSVLGAIAGSSRDGASRRLLAGVESWTSDGPAALVGTDRTVRVDDALFAAAAWSVALDYDDYVSFGHTGHSSVLVPMLLATETGSSDDEQLVAQVIANEVEARLGGACLIGPQNGQLWSYIHAAGAALAAGRLLGLDRSQLAHALAISLYQPVRATAPGFMAPESKLLTAAEPAVAGLRAARLAACGTTGPLDILDDPTGFFSAFADAPLRGLLGGLGTGWATLTLCVKTHPGCAYLDTALDAVAALAPIDPAEVERIDVDASLLTCQMDAMSRPYAGGPPTPVTVTFSVPWSLAIAVVGGELTPEQLEEGWLRDHEAAVTDLAGRVRLRHDWALTRSAAGHFVSLLPPRRLAADAGVRTLVGGLLRQRRGHLSSVGGLGDLSGIVDMVRHSGNGGTLAGGPRDYWDPDALESFTMTFPARVAVVLRGGKRLEAEADVPVGGAGHPVFGPETVADGKLARWGSRLSAFWRN